MSRQGPFLFLHALFLLTGYAWFFRPAWCSGSRWRIGNPSFLCTIRASFFALQRYDIRQKYLLPSQTCGYSNSYSHCSEVCKGVGGEGGTGGSKTKGLKGSDKITGFFNYIAALVLIYPLRELETAFKSSSQAINSNLGVKHEQSTKVKCHDKMSHSLKMSTLQSPKGQS